MTTQRPLLRSLLTSLTAAALVSLAGACGDPAQQPVDESLVGGSSEALVRGADGTWSWPGLTITRPVLNRFWGSAANDVWGVGNGSITVHWDGTTWRKFPNPGKTTLRAVWGTAANNVYAVGDDSTIMRWNGTAWSMMTGGAIPTAVDLNDVYALSSTDVWVVGDDGVILRYNGTAWSGLTPPALNNLITVWGPSASTVWIGGDLSGEIDRQGKALEGDRRRFNSCIGDDFGREAHAAGQLLVFPALVVVLAFFGCVLLGLLLRRALARTCRDQEAQGQRELAEER